jgi:hypothetical protein
MPWLRSIVSSPPRPSHGTTVSLREYEETMPAAMLFSADAGLVRKDGFASGGRALAALAHAGRVAKSPAGDPAFLSYPALDERLKQIPQSIPAIRAAAVIQSAVGMTRILVELITTLRQGIDKLEKQLGQAAGANRISYLRFVPRCRSGPGAAPPGRFRLAARFAMPRRATCRSSVAIAPVMERQERMGPLPAGLSEVSPPDVPRMGRPFDRLLRVGARLL